MYFHHFTSPWSSDNFERTFCCFHLNQKTNEIFFYFCPEDIWVTLKEIPFFLKSDLTWAFSDILIHFFFYLFKSNISPGILKEQNWSKNIYSPSGARTNKVYFMTEIEKYFVPFLVKEKTVKFVRYKLTFSEWMQKDNWISGITPMFSIYRDTLPLLLDDDAISLRRCQQKPPPFEVSFSLAQLVEFLFFIMVGK